LANFKPRLARPGDVIRSEDWNMIQKDLLSEIEALEARYQELRAYVDNMTQTDILTNLESAVGKSYGLNELIPGERETYQTLIMGLITRQWLGPVRGVVDVCRFTLTSKLEELSYWAAATKGNREALAISIRYVDGTSETTKGLFVHDRDALAPKGEDNPYVEYLISPNQKVWYRYRILNPRPEKEVLSVTFKNSEADCTVRIGNVLQIQKRITPRRVS